MKNIILLFFPIIIFSQNKLTILDKESNNPIAGAIVKRDNQVENSNDDGTVQVPDGSGLITISASQYEIVQLEKINIDTIWLNPKYNEIEQVVVGKVNVYDIFMRTLDLYDKKYNTDSSVLYCTYKDKLKIDNKLNSLFVADIDFWAKDNQFDFGVSDTNNFMQISIKKIKYYKTNDKEFNFRNFSNEKSVKAFNTRVFLNGELIILKKALAGIEITSKIVYQNSDTQYIEFISNGSVKPGISFKGNFSYNTKDKAIIHMEIEQQQDNSSRKFKSEDDKLKLYTTNVIVSYDFYNKDGKYVPTYVSIQQKGNIDYKDKTFDFWRTRKIDFINFRRDSQTLKNNINITKDIITQIKDNSIKDIKTLLSAEEQKFVDEP